MRRRIHRSQFGLLLYMNLTGMAIPALASGPAFGAAGVAQVAQIMPLDTWQFRKVESGGEESVQYETVTLPHSCNAEDAQTEAMWRGVTEYTRSFTAEEGRYYVLRLDGAAQRCKVLVNGMAVGGSRAGYSSIALDISEAVHPGENQILVYCDNRMDLDQIPLSADFNFCNGLHGGAALYSFGDVYIDPAANGVERMHVEQSLSDAYANLSVTVAVRNRTGASVKNAVLRVTLLDAEGKEVKTRTTPINVIKDGESANLSLTVFRPHLWHGTRDPYLYTVKAELMMKKVVLDSTETRVGIHSFSATRDGGFTLNGESYPLRGAAMHQDHANGALAMSNEAIDESLALALEMGCNFLRLSHYPHREYTLRRCDELGIVVAAEIPWINHSGVNATDAYFDGICQSMDAMILNGRNHASIHFWGMHNELSGSHYRENGLPVDPQGGIDWSKTMAWNNQLYDRAKALDSTRFIGFAALQGEAFDARPEYKLSQWKADYVSYNLYCGWYSGEMDDFGRELDQAHRDLPGKLVAVSEYGAGANPVTHSTNARITAEIATGGKRHDEEYQNLFHERYLAQIQERPWLAFTSIWALFDFAVSGRDEGGIPYINDKGLVTRDRQMRKDAFYLYKAAWRKDIPVVYLASRRYTPRAPGRAILIAYANTDTLTLSVDGVPVQTLTAPTRAQVVWQFDPIMLGEGRHTLTLDGSLRGKAVTDSVVWQVDPAYEDVTGIHMLSAPENAAVTHGHITETLSIEAAAMDNSPLTYQWYQIKADSETDEEMSEEADEETDGETGEETSGETDGETDAETNAETDDETDSGMDGVPLVGENTATLHIPPELPVGEHRFYCVISAEGQEDRVSEPITVTVFPAELSSERIAEYNLTGIPGDAVPETLPDLTGNGHTLTLSGSPAYSANGCVTLGVEGCSAQVTAGDYPKTGVWIRIEARTPTGIHKVNRLFVLPEGEGLQLMYCNPIGKGPYAHTLQAESNDGTAYILGSQSLFARDAERAEIDKTRCDILVGQNCVRVMLCCTLRDGTTAEETFSFACPGALDMLRTGGFMVLNRPDGLRPLGDDAVLERLFIAPWGEE